MTALVIPVLIAGPVLGKQVEAADHDLALELQVLDDHARDLRGQAADVK